MHLKAKCKFHVVEIRNLLNSKNVTCQNACFTKYHFDVCQNAFTVS